MNKSLRETAAGRQVNAWLYLISDEYQLVFNKNSIGGIFGQQ